MLKNTKILLILLITVGITGCATQVPLPNNAHVVKKSDGGFYLDNVDFSFKSNNQKNFSLLKLCIAQNVSNDNVTLRDSSGSFVGSYTGTYYSRSNQHEVSGANIFKYADEANMTLIARGTTNSVAQQLIPVNDIVKFELQAKIEGSNIKLVFNKITRAQETTGSLQNDGFKPVGVWSGARAPNVYSAIEGLAAQIKACIN